MIWGSSERPQVIDRQGRQKRKDKYRDQLSSRTTYSSLCAVTHVGAVNKTLAFLGIELKRAAR